MVLNCGVGEVLQHKDSRRTQHLSIAEASWNGECPALSGMQGPLEGERKEMVLDGGMQPRRYLDFTPQALGAAQGKERHSPS